MADKGSNNDEDTLEMEGYKGSTVRKVLTWCGIVLTLGCLRLIFFWMPVWYLKATHARSTLAYSTKILVSEIYEKKKTQEICDVKIIDLEMYRKAFDNSMLNEEPNASHKFIDAQFDSIFDEDIVVYFSDGSCKVLKDKVRLVNFKMLPHVWDVDRHKFKRIIGIGPGLTHQEIHQILPYTQLQRSIMKLIYGDNVIKVPDTPFIIIYLREAMTLFYVVQFINSILWAVTDAISYAVIMIVFTLLIILLTSLQTKWNEKLLKKKIMSRVDYVKVLAGSEVLNVTSDLLVPGDRVILPSSGCRVPCDGIVLSGSCIVNESMLTGESVPQTKTSLSMNSEIFNEKECSNHVLYTGTTIIRAQSSEPVQLLVIRTGYSTAQGSIARSILYPRPLDYRLENSVVKFVFVIFTLSLIGAVINDIVEIVNKENVGTIIMNTIKISIMLIPAIMPILSASKLVGTRRLFVRHNIYCLNPAAFNLSGSATCTCFDKTGTLTEDGLDLYCVVPVNSGKFSNSIVGDRSQESAEDRDISTAMACCHSITLIDDILTGDPIDIKMFEWTKWNFTLDQEDGRENHCTISSHNDPMLKMQILHQNVFSSKLQRMSVVVRRNDEPQLRLYCKGSPEILSSLSHPDTVPVNFREILEVYTRKGFRVLAVGTRLLNTNDIDEIKRSTREEMECQFHFLGIIAFENKLKPPTIPTIQELKNANYKIIMITGDNLQTAECVARDCKIIDDDKTVIELDEENDEIKCTISKGQTILADNVNSMETGSTSEDYVFAVSGKAWCIIRDRYEEIMPRILVKSCVFARMSSDQKAEIVKELTALNYGVIMCGDGANDCGALRAADVGVSLAQTESSAAASFTSHDEDISCIIHIIRQGRCSLATSVAFFKFMIMGSMFMTFAARFMEAMHSDLPQGEMIYLTLVCLTNFAIWFPRSEAYMEPLTPDLPFDTVIHFVPIFSFISNLLIFVAFQVGNMFLVKRFHWYKIPNDQLSYESYAIFCTVALQMVILTLTQSPSYPFTQPFYKNKLLTVSLTITFILDLVITFHPTQLLIKWLQISFPPSLDFPLTMLGLLVANFIICILIEKILVDKILYKRFKNLPYIIKTKRNKKYLDIEDQIKEYKWVTKAFHLSQ